MARPFPVTVSVDPEFIVMLPFIATVPTSVITPVPATVAVDPAPNVIAVPVPFAPRVPATEIPPLTATLLNPFIEPLTVAVLPDAQSRVRPTRPRRRETAAPMRQ